MATDCHPSRKMIKWEVLILKFSKSDLTDIINQFRDEKRVFSNESQFQFELADGLQKRGFRTLFEVLSNDKNGKKLYTDLVVDLGNKEYVAIELKYKAAGKPDSKNTKGFDVEKNAFCYGEYKGIKQYMYPQGAVDEGCYGFLKDVERLEHLKNGTLILNFDKENKVRQAYAIIVANSKEGSMTSYWADRKKEIKWYDYNLGDGRKISGKLDEWKTGKTLHESVFLNNEYECRWEEYYSNTEQTDYPLKYMIMEIY